jgi:hypothetical protein
MKLADRAGRSVKADKSGKRPRPKVLDGDDKQLRGIFARLAKASGKTRAQAAKLCGVSERQIYRDVRAADALAENIIGGMMATAG